MFGGWSWKDHPEAVAMRSMPRRKSFVVFFSSDLTSSFVTSSSLVQQLSRIKVSLSSPSSVFSRLSCQVCASVCLGFEKVLSHFKYLNATHSFQESAVNKRQESLKGFSLVKTYLNFLCESARNVIFCWLDFWHW